MYKMQRYKSVSNGTIQRNCEPSVSRFRFLILHLLSQNKRAKLLGGKGVVAYVLIDTKVKHYRKQVTENCSFWSLVMMALPPFLVSNQNPQFGAIISKTCHGSAFFLASSVNSSGYHFPQIFRRFQIRTVQKGWGHETSIDETGNTKLALYHQIITAIAISIT